MALNKSAGDRGGPKDVTSLERQELVSIDIPLLIRNRPAVSTAQSRDLIASSGHPVRSLKASKSAPLSGEIEVPGDKSISHRALILGGIAKGQTLIRGLLESEDVLHTANAVREFGATVERLEPARWRVHGAQWRSPSQPIDCGNSGTGARLLMGAAAGFRLDATFMGDASLSSRPMERVLKPLRKMGARTTGSTLPVSIHGGSLRGIRHINERASAQVKSAVLLAGLRASGVVEVAEPMPSRNHTENMLKAFGCDIEVSDGSIRLGEHRMLDGTEVRVPGDPSSAAFPIVAALLVPGSKVKLRNIMVSPLRTGLLATLKEMGAHIEFENLRTEAGEHIADVIVKSSSLHGVEIPSARAPSMIDEYPILAVAAAFASGPTIMHSVGELRVKESNRLAAIVDGLRACGIEAREEADSLLIDGAGPNAAGGGEIDSRADHRIAMSFLVFGLAAQRPVTANGAEMIATSFPGFAQLMSSLGAQIA
ncbi:MAG: 3-phosphoshikimate 1-carboxyvinyltransferase [Steroidobacteraceae bacterium]